MLYMENPPNDLQICDTNNNVPRITSPMIIPSLSSGYPRAGSTSRTVYCAVNFAATVKIVPMAQIRNLLWRMKTLKDASAEGW